MQNIAVTLTEYSLGLFHEILNRKTIIIAYSNSISLAYPSALQSPLSMHTVLLNVFQMRQEIKAHGRLTDRAPQRTVTYTQRRSRTNQSR